MELTVGMIKIAIIDYEMGNLFSVHHACRHVGLEPTITKDPKVINSSDAAILPGVGAFAESMANLNRLDLIPCLHDFISTGKPFMGICLGLQLLFTESEEFGSSKGLGIIAGQVLKFPSKSSSGKNVCVPQIGWNKIYSGNFPDSKKKWERSPLRCIKNGEFMYFVHSFYTKPSSVDVALSLTNYEGFEYCSSIIYKNIFATQFHPEKSALKGIEVYKNWAEDVKKHKGV